MPTLSPEQHDIFLNLLRKTEGGRKAAAQDFSQMRELLKVAETLPQKPARKAIKKKSVVEIS